MKSWQCHSDCLTWFTFVGYSNKRFQRSDKLRKTQTQKNSSNKPDGFVKTCVVWREGRWIHDIESHVIKNQKIYIYIYKLLINSIFTYQMFRIWYTIVCICQITFDYPRQQHCPTYKAYSTSHVGQMLPCTHPLRQLPEVGNDDPAEDCSWVRGPLRASLW